MKDLIKNTTWKNIWAGDWNLLDISDWEEHYLGTLKIGNRPFLNKTAFIIKNGKSSCWVDENYLQDSCNLLVKIYKNKKDAERLAKTLKQAVDMAMGVMKRKITADKQTYVNYCNAIREYYIPHVHVKYLVDGLSDKQRKEFLPILQDARVYAEPVFAQTLIFDREFAKQLSKKMGIKPELILSMTRDELLDYFDHKKLPKKSELAARYKFSVAVTDSNKNFQVFTGSTAERMAKNLIPISDSKILNGQIAYKGIVRGKVLIIMDPEKPKGFKKGDILVTGMTRPEYLHLMHKAAAFVTDAGGILSHAAIVARELKKPCVIGTRIATKVLKDGDMVEVDANKGIVRKLK